MALNARADERGADGRTWRPDIDGLRAVAIVLVLLFHYYPEISKGGFVGVDVFFVISGYLITCDLLRRREERVSVVGSITAFYQRRIRRIFPALLALLVGAAIFGWFFLLPYDFANLARYLAAGSGFATNFVLWSEAGYFDQAIYLKPLAHLWSLAIEEQFYIVWPLLILMLGRLGRAFWLPLVITMLVVASLAYCLFVTPADSTAAYYSPLARGWELGVGGLLAIGHLSGRGTPQSFASGVAAFGGLALIVWAAFFVATEVGFPGWQATLPVAGAALIIWFAAGTSADKFLLGLPPIRYVGLISYPLYLWHWPLLSFFRILSPGKAPFFGRSVLLVASILLAVATFHLIERPVRRLAVRVAAGSGLVAMIVFLVWAVAILWLGWGGISLNPQQLALTQPIDTAAPYRTNKCLLVSTQTSADFADECRPTPGRPEMLLWGDSQAASFYSGLKAREDALGVSISQRTSGTCAPSMIADQPETGHCDEINASTRRYIETNRPELVFIYSRWAEHGDPVPRITAVVQFLRENGVRTIIMGGPSPLYRPTLQGVLIHDHLFDPEIPRELPTQPGTFPTQRALDDQLRTLAKALGIGYVSILDKFCGADSCQVRVTDKLPDGLLLTDADHMSPTATAALFADLEAKDLDLTKPDSRLAPR